VAAHGDYSSTVNFRTKISAIFRGIYVKRMEAGAIPRRTMEGRLFIGRRKGRPRLRWMDDVVADLRVMKIKQWTEKAEDREQWRLVVKETKAHPGL
jgi:hypothetical protein